MTRIVIETDLGRDPDDYLALCYLANRTDIQIDAIGITPGDPDQIILAQNMKRRLGLTCPVGVSKKGRDKRSLSGPHKKILDSYSHVTWHDLGHDGLTSEIFKDVITPEHTIFVIGPMTGLAAWYAENYPTIREWRKFPRVIIQGGFLPYSMYEPSVILEKFVGKSWVPTFNLNGDKKAAKIIANADRLTRMYITKAFCHSFTFEETDIPKYVKQTTASNMFVHMLKQLKPGKAVHDLAAATLITNVDLIIQVLIAKLSYGKNAWGFSHITDDELSTREYHGTHQVVGELHREALREEIFGWCAST